MTQAHPPAKHAGSAYHRRPTWLINSAEGAACRGETPPLERLGQISWSELIHKECEVRHGQRLHDITHDVDSLSVATELLACCQEVNLEDPI